MEMSGQIHSLDLFLSPLLPRERGPDSRRIRGYFGLL
jgi:hypothetical protein